MQMQPAISLRSYGEAVRRHRHDHHQFVLPLRGVLELGTSVGATPVDAETAVLIPAGMDHSFRARGDNRFAVIDVGGDRMLPLRGREDPTFSLSPALRHQLALLEARGRGGEPAASGRHLWNALLFDCLETSAAAAAGAHRFAAAVECIRADAAVTVTVLARSVGVSTARLHALFRQHAATTPGACILQARLERGARALIDDHRSIADIALDCGFSEHSAFTRAFARVYGMSPAQYRQRYRVLRH